jgi:hypothetical protein
MKDKWVRWVWIVSLAFCQELNAVGPLPAPLQTQPATATLDPTLTMTSNVLPPPTNQATVTLSWGDASNTNLVVSVYQSPDLAASPGNWATLANVTNASSLTVPATGAAGFFRAVAIGQFIDLLWNYPSTAMTPSLVFNLYWRPNAGSAWTVVSQIGGTNTSARLLTGNSSGDYAMTAEYTDSLVESDLSNIVSCTNGVGGIVALKISTP